MEDEKKKIKLSIESNDFSFLEFIFEANFPPDFKDDVPAKKIVPYNTQERKKINEMQEFLEVFLYNCL